jgi:hypothetical protein
MTIVLNVNRLLNKSWPLIVNQRQRGASDFMLVPARLNANHSGYYHRKKQ